MSELALEDYPEFVGDLFRPAEDILAEMTPHKMAMLHAFVGLSGEVGKALEIIKKHVMAGKKLDLGALEKEMGDIEFYLEAARQVVGFLRDDCIFNNIEKLSTRYANGYSNEASEARVDVKD